MDSTDPPSTERITESSRADVAAASLGGSQAEAEKAEDTEQVKLLADAGLDIKVARTLPERPIDYVRGMIQRMKNGDFATPGLLASIRDGTYSPPKPVALEWAKGVGAAYRNAWEKRTPEQRDRALRTLLTRVTPAERPLIEAVLAGKEQPHERLIGEVCKLAPIN